MPERRILLHPGFHKTGTSSAQHFLWVNRERIAKHAHLFMLRHLKPVTNITHRFSRTHDPLTLVDLSDALDDAFANVPDDDRDILISNESLCGHLPGWPGVQDYRAAPTLLEYLTEYLADRFDTSSIRIVLTTRDADSWLFSAYRHHLKGHRLTLDYPRYFQTFCAAADFGKIETDIREAVIGEVLQLPLQVSLRHPLGPGGALLAALKWPESTEGYTPVGQGNSGPDTELWSEFLRLNRSRISDAELIERKEALAKEASLGGWRPAQS